MVRYLLKKQLTTAVVFTILLSFVLITQIGTSWVNSFNGQYYNEQCDYLARYDLTDRTNFFASLNKDTNAAYQRVREIEEFMAYEGDIPEGIVNPLDIASSGAMYMDYNMVVWRQNMLNLPGQFTESISGDKYMLEALSQRLSYIKSISSILENHKEIAARGIRRGGSSSYKYELAFKELESISLSFPVEDVAYTQNFLDFMQEDWYFAVLIAVVFFGAFSTVEQQRVSWIISVSSYGPRRYALTQIIVATLTTVMIFILYHIGVLFACSLWNPKEIAWELPIQCVFGNTFDSYEVILNLTVWEYTLIVMLLKAFFGLLLANVVLFLSLLSKNNTIAAVCALTTCGSLILLHSEIPLGELLIGNANILLEGLCWTKIGSQTISYSTIYIVVTSILINIVVILTVFFAKPILRRRSK